MWKQQADEKSYVIQGNAIKFKLQKNINFEKKN